MGYRLGPIVIIEDSEDDQQTLRAVFDRLNVPNELKFFETAEDAFIYIETTKDNPFLIISDMNLPRMSGAQLKTMLNLNEHTSNKAIPFVFLTSTAAHEAVLASYKCSSQGYFVKSANIDSLEHMLELIITYWKLSRHPNPKLT
jgi:DNA-binding NarL/FixJ family response regulator